MIDFNSLEPSIDPNNRITFLLDWELTMKCNLDCSYCGVGIYSGHDNSTSHPNLDDCFKTIDFMFKYVDLYMSRKPQGIQYVVLNVYGGESLHYPDIVEVLKRCREVYQENYQERWHLTITTTTNAIVNQRKMSSIIELIDEFTCSYHPEATDKQKDLFKKNLLQIRNSGKRIKTVILMHTDPVLFKDSQDMIKWCQENNIRNLPRQVDHYSNNEQWNYNTNQIKWFGGLYKKHSYKSSNNLNPVKKDDKFDLSDTGRACCGGRQLCKDSDFKKRDFFVANKFPDWYCSVNEFFLYIKQVNGEIYVNKDCKMNFQGSVGPIGNLNDTRLLLQWTKSNIEKDTVPIIQCKKSWCHCGLCASKAKDLSTFKDIMRKFRK